MNVNWIEQVTRELDYLCNPAIYKKNYMILDNLVDKVKKIVLDEDLFTAMQENVKKLCKECYPLDEE